MIGFRQTIVGFRIKCDEKSGIEYHVFCEKILKMLTEIDGGMWGEREDFESTSRSEFTQPKNQTKSQS